MVLFKGDMDWKKWFIKLGKGLGVTLVATGLIYTADYINLTEFPTEYAFISGLVVLVLNQVGNWLQHA